METLKLEFHNQHKTRNAPTLLSSSPIQAFSFWKTGCFSRRDTIQQQCYCLLCITQVVPEPPIYNTNTYTEIERESCRRELRDCPFFSPLTFSPFLPRRDAYGYLRRHQMESMKLCCDRKTRRTKGKLRGKPTTNGRTKGGTKMPSCSGGLETVELSARSPLYIDFNLCIYITQFIFIIYL